MVMMTGSSPKALSGGSKMDDMCDDHSSAFSPKVHADGTKNDSKHIPDHKRGVGHPAHHTKGKMPSQLNPDHGPHK